MTTEQAAATGHHDGGDMAAGGTDSTVAPTMDNATALKVLGDANLKAGQVALRRGLAVFPIAISWDDGKHKTNKRPLTRNGHKDATTDPQVFAQLAGDALTRLKSGEVLAVGAVPGSVGCVVFDGDKDDSKDGPAYLRDALKLSPYNYRPTTASGGVHDWRRKRDPDVAVGNRSPWQDEGVDIRADDGWVVAPGTISPWGNWTDPTDPGWGNFASVPESVWQELVGESPNGDGTTSGAKSTGSGWKCYDPAVHRDQLHPATVDLLDWLTDPERGDRQVDLAAVTFRTRKDGEPYLEVTRPGKEAGISATLGYVNPGTLYVFTTKWPGLQNLSAYDRWDLDHALGSVRSESSHVAGVTKTAKSTKSPEIGPKLWKATDLKPSEPITWLVRDHLARGAVAVLIGDEGIGKSLWWVLIVVHITTGKPLPMLGLPTRDPAHVVLVITEDGWTDTVRPRLEAAGADMDYVIVIAEQDDGSGAPVFPRDLGLVDAAHQRHPDLALVVVDAWLDTVPGKFTVKDPQHARQALHPWREIALRTDTAVLLLAHSNRADVGSLRDRVGATGALRQKARTLLYAAQPPDDAGHLYLGPDKANNAGMAPAVHYRIDAMQKRPATDDDPGTVPVLQPVAITDATMQKHHDRWRVEARKAAAAPSADDRVWDWLVEYATEHGEDVPRIGVGVWAEDAKAAAREAGHNVQRLAGAVKDHGGSVGPTTKEVGGKWRYVIPGRYIEGWTDPGTTARGTTSQSSQSSQSFGDGEHCEDEDWMPF